MAIADRHGLLVVEDAAQAVDSYYFSKKGCSHESPRIGTNVSASQSVREDSCSFVAEEAPAASGVVHESTRMDTNLETPVIREDSCQFVAKKLVVKKPLGSIGHLAAFSFHETKNVISGEGGMLVVNDERFVRRAEIVWEKGTNRAEFFRGEVNKYGWVDTGSSFLPTEIVSAFLWAQLEHLDEIQTERKRLWQTYWDFFSSLIREGSCRFATPTLPVVPDYATNNAHMFYLLFPDLKARTDFIAQMKARDILTVFHYLPLHSSAFYKAYSESHRPSCAPQIPDLPNCDRYADTLVRLPLYCGLAPDQPQVLAALRDVLGGR